MFLPLTNNPEENFSIVILEEVYNFKQLWNENGFWTLDILDANGVVLVYGVKVITQELLLQQYPHILFNLESENESDPGRLDLEPFFLDVVEK